MRLLLWVFLVTLATFISSASAISNSDKTQVSQLTSHDISTLTRLLAIEDSDGAKRFLRGDAKKDLTANDDSNKLDAEDEERGIISSSITNMISKFKNGWAKWKASALERAFQHMMKNGETPTKLAKRLEIGGVTEPRYEKLYEKYAAWWINFHTNAGTR
uniref:RxLR effector protein n=1 Tax=Phytophthora agathidicida TaxID=1642459 RepID=A0A7G4WI32_9STRA|nr:PaRXLR43 [Phytophthora agathidicida]